MAQSSMKSEFKIRPGQIWSLGFKDRSIGENWYYVVIKIDNHRLSDSVTLLSLYTGGFKQGKLSTDNGAEMLKDHNSRSFRDIYWKFIC